MPREMTVCRPRSTSKPALIDAQVVVGRQAFDHFDRDAVSRVQDEGVLAGDRVRAGRLCFLEDVAQELEAVFEVAEELFLLLLDGGLDPAHALGQFGIRLVHDFRDDGDELVEERLAAADLVGVEDGPAEQAADDVALLFRTGPDVFMDAESEGPDMVRHAADADAVGDGRGRTRRPSESATAATIGLKISVSKTDPTPWRQAAARSRPMPVSMFFLGRGSSWPGPVRLNWVKTRFQISTSLGPAPW